MSLCKGAAFVRTPVKESDAEGKKGVLKGILSEVLWFETERLPESRGAFTELRTLAYPNSSSLSHTIYFCHFSTIRSKTKQFVGGNVEHGGMTQLEMN